MPEVASRRRRTWHVQTKDNFNYKPGQTLLSSKASTTTADDRDLPSSSARPAPARNKSILKRLTRAITIRGTSSPSPRRPIDEPSPSSPEVWVQNTQANPPDPPIESPPVVAPYAANTWNGYPTFAPNPQAMYPPYYGPLQDSPAPQQQMVQQYPVWAPFPPYNAIQFHYMNGQPIPQLLQVPGAPQNMMTATNSSQTSLQPAHSLPPPSASAVSQEQGRQVPYMPDEKENNGQGNIPPNIQESQVVPPTAFPIQEPYPERAHTPYTLEASRHDGNEDEDYVSLLIRREHPINEESANPILTESPLPTDPNASSAVVAPAQEMAPPSVAPAASVSATTTSDAPPSYHSSMDGDGTTHVDITTPPTSPIRPAAHTGGAAAAMLHTHCTCGHVHHAAPAVVHKEAWNPNLVAILSFLSVMMVVFAIRDITFGHLMVKMTPTP